jgi:tripartite-type tricarboxylate transporter receptor subunit TctC
MLKRRTLLFGAAASFFAGRSTRLHADGQTIKQTARVIVPFPAGGGTDVLARIFAEELKESYAATTVVENRTGGAGRIAVEYVKNADPDGSVILFTTDFVMTVYPHSFRSLSYDPIRDFTPVAPVAKSPLVFCIGPAVPNDVNLLSRFVEWCRANPDKAIYASTSAGGTPHFTGLLLSQKSGVSLTPVHYKGGAPALQDLIAGHVSSSINPIGEVLPFATAGQIRALAVTAPQRSNLLPDAPTMQESGYDIVVEPWLGVLVPAKAPTNIVSALNLVGKDMFGAPAIAQKLAALGNEPAYQTPTDFAATIRADIERWGPIVKASGFVAD